MIRLSDLTALDFTNEFALDQTQYKIHLYQQKQATKTNTQIILDDNYNVKSSTRKFGMCTFFNNVLLGTPNFYPTQGLGISDYHENSTIQTLLNKQNLPLLEFKKAKLYFSQGVLGDSSILGHWFRMYVISGGDEVTLISFVDLKTDSQAVATPPKYFENQVYNECVDFDVIDLDYLLNSNITEVNEIRDFIFNGNKPSTYHIEYGVITNNSFDYFNENGYEFSMISPTNINTQSLSIGENSDGLLASLTNDDSGFYLNARLYHERFAIEPYMNGLKNDNETYEIQYQFQIDGYIDTDLIDTQYNILTAYDFNQISFRPIIKSNIEYCVVNLTIRVKNQNTSLVFRRNAQIIIDDYIQNFKPQTPFVFDVTKNVVNKVVNRNVNKIIASKETPKILQIEKRVYVRVNDLETLDLFDSTFVTEIQLNDNITGFTKLTLKIGEQLYESIVDGSAVFELDSTTYQTNSTRYILLDESNKAISMGKINKK